MEFNRVLERRLKLTEEVLGSKEKEYANKEDRFHNFNVIAEVLECTPIEALIGPMSKHIFSVIDILTAQKYDPWLFKSMIKHINNQTKILEEKSSEKSKHLTLKYLDEKIGDTINYLILLEGILHETYLYEINEKEEDDDLGEQLKKDI